MEDAVIEKYDNLKKMLKRYGRLAVALSGGMDSAFLAYAASQALGEDMVCISIVDDIFPKMEAERAAEFAERHGIRHICINTVLTDNDIFIKNGRDRCYLCKKLIFGMMIRKAVSEGFDHMADGTNKDDLEDHRPGLRALWELGVLSPLRDSGLGKNDIRSLSSELVPDAGGIPPLACLATRIPFTRRVTREKVLMIDEAESYIRGLGFYDVRVRCDDRTARIEVGKSEFSKLTPCILDEMDIRLGDMGFCDVYFDLGGYRKGKMDNG